MRLLLEAGEVELVILFGSHARGDQVRFDPDTGFRSDLDILVVTRTAALAETLDRSSPIEERAERAGRAPVTLIAHDFEFVRSKIEWGHYFFNDIRREGVLLYDSGRFTLPSPRVLSADERRQQAKEDFERWFESAGRFYELYEFSLGKQYTNEAAFNLHQATERTYSALLLVFTNYKPKTHNIETLGKQAARFAPALAGTFPRGTSEDDALFKKLKDAYVDARYNKNYAITEEELLRLAGYVRALRAEVEARCREKIAAGE